MVKLIGMLGSLILVVVAFAPRPSSAALWREQRFVEEKLIDTGSLGLPNDGMVAAFGDFNADQLLDLFYLSADQRSLSTYIWSRAGYKWVEKPEARIRTRSDFIITNVVPGDFNYDGRLDLLLMGGKNPGGWWGDDETVEMAVYLQSATGNFCTSALSRTQAELTVPRSDSSGPRSRVVGCCSAHAIRRDWDDEDRPAWSSVGLSFHSQALAERLGNL